MNSFQSALIQQLEATHEGEPWYGTSRTALLRGVTAEQAAGHPVLGGHSIWELVLHMTAWTNEVTRRLGGHPAAEPVEGDWPATPAGSESAWTTAIGALAEAHAGLLAKVRALPAGRWEDPVGQSPAPAPGSEVTVTGMLIGLAQHDAYHTAQVALLRRAAGSL